MAKHFPNRKMLPGLTVGVLALFHGQVQALFNGLALTPQMGWNTWNAFGCGVDEKLILTTAQMIVNLGLRDLGYKYVIADDCWSTGRNSSGYLIPNTSKFPNGIKSISDQLHDLGLGFGMYANAGSLTCGQYAGSLGSEEIDARTFASWGVDYLKYDNCYNEGQSGTPLITYGRYKKMSDALNATGRPILYSMCNWGEDFPWKWAQTVANSWRISGDIYDSYNRPDDRCPCTGHEGIDCTLPGFHCSAMNILDKVAHFPDKGVPGAWNDMDMLEVGNGGMTDDEYITHFSMWAALKSPLILGNDMTKMNAATLSILSNSAVIAINQDPAGTAAARRWRYEVEDKDQFGQGNIQLWSGSLSGGDMVVVFLNAGNTNRDMNASLVDVFWDYGGRMAPQASQSWEVYDLWGNRMDNDTANAIIAASNAEDWESGLKKDVPEGVLSVGSQYRYNSTSNGGYAAGLERGDSVLLGQKFGTVAAYGTLTASVRRHGVRVFRLRQQSQSKDGL